MIFLWSSAISMLLFFMASSHRLVFSTSFIFNWQSSCFRLCMAFSISLMSSVALDYSWRTRLVILSCASSLT